MRFMCRPIFTRRRLLAASVLIVILALAGWFGARYSVARWAAQRALAAAGLEPATFQVQSVGLNAIHITNLSIGTKPWLTAGSVDVTYTLPGVLAGRVSTLGVQGARWTVRERDGVIDWGMAPKKTSGPLTLALPCDRVDLRESVIRVIVDDATHDMPITGQLSPLEPDGIAGRFDVLALGRTVTIVAEAKTTTEVFTVEVEGSAGYPTAPASDLPVRLDPTGAAADSGSTTPPARVRAVLLRGNRDGSTQIDVTAVLESLTERAGDMEIGVSHASATGHAVFDGAGRVNGLTSSISVQNVRAGQLTMHSADLRAAKLDGPRLHLEAAASGEGWQLHDAQGTATLDTNPNSIESPGRSATLTIEMHTPEPVSLDYGSRGITGLLGSIACSMRVRVDGSGLRVLEGSLTMDGGSLQSGDLALSGVTAGIIMRSPEAVEVTSVTAITGDGGTISAAPFTFDPRAPRLQTRLSVTNLSLAEWLPLLTRDHAAGEGRVSGHADVSLDLTTGAPRLGQLRGELRGDPQHGFIQVTDADALGTMLEGQDPRFAADGVMREARDRIVSALRDFAFSALTVDLSRRDDQTIAQAYISGFGRHGDDPQGLNLTLDLHVQDAFVDLASRIMALSKNRAAARNALDRFFEAPASEDAPP